MRRALGFLLATSLLAGCSMEPHYRAPAMPVPPTWPQGDAYLKRSEAALPLPKERPALVPEPVPAA